MSNDIEITIGKTSITTTRDASVCVVYMGTVGEHEGQHTAPFGVLGDATRESIQFEPGGSLINAGLLHDHLARPHNALKRKLDAGEFTVFESPAKALDGVTVKVAADMIRLTRHAATLRAWLTVEETRDIKRKTLIEGLRARLRAYADHSTPIATVTQLHRPSPAAEPKRSKRAAVG